MDGSCGVHAREEMYIEYCWGNFKKESTWKMEA